MPDIFEESNQSVEEKIGMSLERARDITALTYINLVFRIASRTLGVELPSHQAVVEGVSDLTVALNCGANIAFCMFVGDRQVAEEMLARLKTLVEEIPVKHEAKETPPYWCRNCRSMRYEPTCHVCQGETERW